MALGEYFGLIGLGLPAGLLLLGLFQGPERAKTRHSVTNWCLAFGGLSVVLGGIVAFSHMGFPVIYKGSDPLFSLFKGSDPLFSLFSLTWATRHEGHRVSCPSCDSDAVVTGTAIAAPLKSFDGELIVETQQYLPSKFECVACQLKIASLSQLAACGLGNTYKATFTYDLAEYYTPNDDYAGYEEDNNEP